RKMADYLCDNFYLTISGNFRTPTLIDAMLEVGSDRIMFSVDYPFEKTIEAVKWFDELHISERDRLKIGRTNAMALFKLGSPKAASGKRSSCKGVPESAPGLWARKFRFGSGNRSTALWHGPLSFRWA